MNEFATSATENNLWAMGNNNNGQLGINSDSEYISGLIKVTQFPITHRYNRINVKGFHTSLP